MGGAFFYAPFIFEIINDIKHDESLLIVSNIYECYNNLCSKLIKRRR